MFPDKVFGSSQLLLFDHAVVRYLFDSRRKPLNCGVSSRGYSAFWPIQAQSSRARARLNAQLTEGITRYLLFKLLSIQRVKTGR